MLTDYNAKRNPKKTKEPFSDKLLPKKPHKPIFTVQKHDATRLHFDLRLEHKGVLKSWAIPKEPSKDPEVKRLAIETEDHPYDYAYFSGDIPEGEYGAGHVDLWDKGTFDMYGFESGIDNEVIFEKAYEKGHIHAIFHGKKLKGEYSLLRFRTEKNNTWLFFKNEDDKPSKFKKTESIEATLSKLGARKTELNLPIKPMLATLVKKPFTSEDWIFEVKHDGYRIICEIEGPKVKLYSRNTFDYTNKFKDVSDDLSKRNLNAILDGELVVLDENGKSDFSLLQKYIKSGKGSVVYYVFDLLKFGEYNLTNIPLIYRKTILKSIIKDSKFVKYSEHIEKNGENFYKLAKEEGLEGIMAKEKNSKYNVDTRTSNWQKIKTIKTIDAYIVGFTEPKNSNEFFGSLCLAIKKGKGFKYIGNVGTGFDSVTKQSLLELFSEIKLDKPSVTNPTKVIGFKKITWIKPKFICTVKYAEFTNEHLLRQAAFIDLKNAKYKKIKTENVNDISTDLKSSKLNSKEEIVKVGNQSLKLTNLDKLYWPKQKINKGELVRYYDKISDYILPYLKDRPESLNRHPNGIEEEGFFQKDIPENYPDWLKTKMIHSESVDRDINYLICNDEETLIYMANLGCIEINPWHSRLGSLENPDYMIFDLDPLNVSFQKVVQVALKFKEVLEKLDIKSYPKTSGATGIHIYVPLPSTYSYDQVLDFAKLIAIQVNKELPKLTSIERSPEKRNKRVYLDVMQNIKGHTIATVYSARPKPFATVATPLDWSEVNEKLSPKNFNIFNIFERLNKKGDIWQPVLGDGINMKKALEKLMELE